MNATWLKRVLSTAITVLVLAGILPTSIANADSGEKPEYILSMVPQLTSVVLHRNWTPLAEHVSKELGITIRLKVYKSIPLFEADLMQGVPDFAFMNPYQALVFREVQGYEPLLRDRKRLLAGILVVRADSPLKTVQDLDGKTLAFPSPNAFGASLYMRTLLTVQEKIDFTPRYLTTHANVYRHVLRGRVAAGGGVNNTLRKEPSSLKSLLRVLYQTPSVPAHPLCAHARVPADVQAAFTAAVLRLRDDERGRSILKAVQLPSPIEADFEKD